MTCTDYVFLIAPINIQIYINSSIYIYTYIHYIRTYVRTYVRTYITYVRTYVHTYIRTYVRTYVHTYIHTYTPLSSDTQDDVCIRVPLPDLLSIHGDDLRHSRVMDIPPVSVHQRVPIILGSKEDVEDCLNQDLVTFECFHCRIGLCGITK